MSANKSAAGRSYPIGATVQKGGVNFCIYARHGTRVDLLLFEQATDATAAQIVQLDPERNRTYDYWHVFVPGIGAGQLYGYRVYGPNEPSAGLRFDPEKLLLDPYTLAVANTESYDRTRAAAPGDNTGVAMKSVVADPSQYDWEGDAPIERPFIGAVIYELHVAGFTRNPNSGVSAVKRGAFAGLIEKISIYKAWGSKPWS